MGAHVSHTVGDGVSLNQFVVTANKKKNSDDVQNITGCWKDIVTEMSVESNSVVQI